MKTGGVCRVLCGLLMLVFLASSDQGCDTDDYTERVQLIVNNNTATGFIVTVNGESQFVDAGDSVSFDVPADDYYTVTTSSGLSKEVDVDRTNSSVSFP